MSKSKTTNVNSGDDVRNTLHGAETKHSNQRTHHLLNNISNLARQLAAEGIDPQKIRAKVELGLRDGYEQHHGEDATESYKEIQDTHLHVFQSGFKEGDIIGENYTRLYIANVVDHARGLKP